MEALEQQKRAETETREALTRLESEAVEPVTAQAVEEELHPMVEATRALLDAWRTEPARARHELARLGVRVEVSPATGKRGAREVPLRITGSYDGLVQKFPGEREDRELVDSVGYPRSIWGGSEGGNVSGN